MLEFRNLEEPLFGYRYFRRNGYFPVRWLRVRNSIHHEQLDKWMSSSRKRQIARGLKNGASMEIASDPETVKAFFAMLKKYYSAKIHRYLPDFRFLHLLPNNLLLGGRVKSLLSVIRKSDRGIGVPVFR